MTSPSIQFHKIWIEQCAAAEDIRKSFGLADALHYLIGEKLFSFVQASEQDSDFAAELPAFVFEIRRIFSPREIAMFLNELERTKFLAPLESEPDAVDLDDDPDDDPWIDNPISGAKELLRFARIRQLLQE